MRALTFGDVGPAEGDVFGSISKSNFLREGDGALIVPKLSGRPCLNESDFIVELAEVSESSHRIVGDV